MRWPAGNPPRAKAVTVLPAPARSELRNFPIPAVRSEEEHPRRSKTEFQAELHGARPMRLDRMQEGAALQATCIARRIVQPAVTVHGLVRLVSAIGIENQKLCVVEEIECF